MTHTNIPQRLDRLPWSRWHWRVVVALGVTWILDGLEVTIVGVLGPILTNPVTLHLTEAEVGWSASIYLTGAVVGALLFSYLTDQQGRKKWFLVTLFVYLSATVLTAFSWDLWSFACFRFLTGAGIGGEYAAINSAIDELIPARARGRTDLAINGSWWIGTVAGALLVIPLLNPDLIPERLGWRLCFLLGGIMGVSVVLIRRLLPESPRWLITKGRTQEAETIVTAIEETVKKDHGIHTLPEPQGSITIRSAHHATVASAGRELFKTYPTRTLLGIALMATQSFLYNAIFFTFALVLVKFYGVSPTTVGYYLLPFAVSNFLGPFLLGPLFDTIGRRPMISLTYGLSGVLLAGTGYLFWRGDLTAATQTIAWSVIFFFASAGASSAYLTVSEVFPLEIRAMAIAFFFVVGQGAGIVAPWLFGYLVQHSATDVFGGDLLGAALMIGGAIIAWRFGVDAEGRPLEQIAPPLSTGAADPEEPKRTEEAVNGS